MTVLRRWHGLKTWDICKMLDNLKGRDVYIHLLGNNIGKLSKSYTPKVDKGGSPVRAVRETFYKNLIKILRTNDIQTHLYMNKRGNANKCLEGMGYNDVGLTYHTCNTSCNIWNIKTAHILGYLYFDKLGYSGWSEMANNPKLFLESQETGIKAAERFYKKIYGDIVGNNRSIYKQRNLGFKMDMPYIFCPVQKPNDSVAIHSRIPTYDLAYELVNRFKGSKEIAIVVKQHPSDYSKTLSAWLQGVDRRYSNIVRTSASIHDIIPGAEAVVTVNSGVGFESLLHLIPVFTSGKTDYEWVTNRLATLDDLDTIPDKISSTVNAVVIKKFICYFLSKYLINCNDKAAITSRLEGIV